MLKVESLSDVKNMSDEELDECELMLEDLAKKDTLIEKEYDVEKNDPLLPLPFGEVEETHTSKISTSDPQPDCRMLEISTELNQVEAIEKFHTPTMKTSSSLGKSVGLVVELPSEEKNPLGLSKDFDCSFYSTTDTPLKMAQMSLDNINQSLDFTTEGMCSVLNNMPKYKAQAALEEKLSAMSHTIKFLNRVVKMLGESCASKQSALSIAEPTPFGYSLGSPINKFSDTNETATLRCNASLSGKNFFEDTIQPEMSFDQESIHQSTLQGVEMDAISNLQQRNHELNDRVRKFEEVEQALLSQQTAMEQNRRCLEEEIKKLQAINSELEEDMQLFKKAEQETRHTISEFAAEIEALKSQAARKEENNQHLNQKVKNLESQIEKGHNTSLLPSVVKAAADGDSPNSVSELHEHCVSLESDNGKLYSAIEEYGEKIDRYKMQLKEKDVMIDVLRHEKEELMKQKEEAKKSSDRAWEQNAALAGHANSHQKIKYLQSIKMERKQLQERIGALEHDLMKRTRLIAEMKNREHMNVSQASFSTEPEPEIITSRSIPESARNNMFRRIWNENQQLKSDLTTLQSLQHSKRKATNVHIT